MGISEYRALKSALEQLLLHLLKWQKQSSKKDDLHDLESWYRSWRVSVNTQRTAIRKVLDDNRGLTHKVDEVMPKAYRWAREAAADAMDCKIKDFPAKCPWSYDEIMVRNWLP